VTGAVPRRVDGDVKAGLLDLVGHAVAAGWSLRRACGLLEVNHPRVLGWHARLGARAGLVDCAPGPTQAPHALMDWERAAILAVYDTWHEVDRSYRKLAHRGSGEGRTRRVVLAGLGHRGARAAQAAT
jgi:putative transposase